VTSSGTTAAVAGFNNSTTGTGAGVAGQCTSPAGVGVLGRGGKFAGLFEGDVNVTGQLIVAGISFASLVQRITALEHKAPPPTSKPSISVSKSGTTFTVNGTGFLSNTTVTIRVTADPAQPVVTFQQTSERDGTLKNASTPISPCPAGTGLHFVATDGRPDPTDLTGVLNSNTFNISC
jgi:hypothetical protein